MICIREKATGIYKIIYDISNTNDLPFINTAVICDYSLYASPVANSMFLGALPAAPTYPSASPIF